VEKATLLIESTPDDSFLIAACSFCGKQIKPPGNTLVHKEQLRKKFEIHCRTVHPEAICPNLSTPSLAS
jgi:hypothetical protein